MKILGIIPARSGSKGLPDKNILPLAGKPLIAWTIEAAKAAPAISRLLCSTDSEAIAETARRFGCPTPFLRPAELAQDRVKVIAVVEHALQTLRRQGESFDAVMTLQCTSPLRDTADINRAIERFGQEKMESLISVCENRHSPYWAYTLTQTGEITPLFERAFAGAQRQALPQTYRPNGALYLTSVRFLETQRDFIGPGTKAFIMRQDHSIDIDTAEDLEYASFLIGGGGAARP